MNLIGTKLEDAFLIHPQIFNDERGYFFETYNHKKLSKFLRHQFVQDNESFNEERNTLRGLHFQTPPYTQAKLIRVISGCIIDIIVDLRIDSPTFGAWDAFILEDKHKVSLYIPRGFAHGYITKQPNTLITYKVDNDYSPEHEEGIIFNDPTLKITWSVNDDDVIISEKDNALKPFTEIKKSLLKKSDYLKG